MQALMTHSWVRARFRLYQLTNAGGVPPQRLSMRVSLLGLKVRAMLYMQAMLQPADALLLSYPRLQQKGYVDVKVVLAGKKGYALRAERGL